MRYFTLPAATSMKWKFEPRNLLRILPIFFSFFTYAFRVLFPVNFQAPTSMWSIQPATFGSCDTWKAWHLSLSLTGTLQNSFPCIWTIHVCCTVGLFVQGSTVYAFVHEDVVFSYLVHNYKSVHTIDLCDLYRAFLFIRLQCGQCHLLCMDSQSAFQGLHGYGPQLLIVKVRHQMFQLHKAGKAVIFRYGYGGDPSNKATNTSTKEAVLHSVLSSERAVGIDFRAAFPHSILFPCHNGYTHMEGNKFPAPYSILDLVSAL